MIELKCLRSISERDVDLLLVEEFVSSPSFCDWFVSKSGIAKTPCSLVGVWHSLTDAELGETDVLCIFRDRSDQQIAILIENKISATAQPDQARRYQDRGKRGREQGNWDEYQTCIVAPQKYLNTLKTTEVYDQSVSYEKIAAYFHFNADARSQHKAEFVKDAILQNRRGYNRVVDTRLTSFIEGYIAYSEKNFQELQIEPAGERGGESTWVKFLLPSLPPKADLRHQLRAGWIKLFFRGQAESIEDLRKEYEESSPAALKSCSLESPLH